MIAGVGIGFRRPHFDALPALLEARPTAVDFVEVVAETFVLGGPHEARALERIQRCVPVLAHGVSSSIGGPTPFDEDWTSALKHWLERHRLTEFTEHLSWSSAGGAHSLELLPLPFHTDSARWAAARTRELSERLERPVWLENTAFYAVQPGSEQDLSAWTTEVLERADCGLLLDLANLWVNAVNHDRDPEADLLAMPLHRVRQVHLAGSRFEEAWGVRVDDHASAIPAEVLSLYQKLMARIGPVPTLVEWDQSIPTLDVLLDEVARVRAVHSSRDLLDEAHP